MALGHGLLITGRVLLAVGGPGSTNVGPMPSLTARLMWGKISRFSVKRKPTLVSLQSQSETTASCRWISCNIVQLWTALPTFYWCDFLDIYAKIFPRKWKCSCIAKPFCWQLHILWFSERNWWSVAFNLFLSTRERTTYTMSEEGHVSLNKMSDFMRYNFRHARFLCLENAFVSQSKWSYNQVIQFVHSSNWWFWLVSLFKTGC